MSDVGIPQATATAIVGIVVLIMIGVFAGGFIVGSIPFGYIVGRLFYRTDIRSQGSGNIGAMNALRTLGKAGAVAVLLLDAFKGFAPVVCARLFFSGHLDGDFVQLAAALIAAGAVIGHCYSPWLRFRGGKGVATFFGALFAICWPAGIVAVLGWGVGAAVTRYSSVGSMLGSVLAPVAVWIFTRSLAETGFAIFAAMLIVLKHRDNIARLRAGTEGPIRLAK